MEPLYIALSIALGFIIRQEVEIRKLKKQSADYQVLRDQYVIVQKENNLLRDDSDSLKEENELLRAASGEIYNCGYTEGKADAFTSLSESVIDNNGKLKVQLERGK